MKQLRPYQQTAVNKGTQSNLLVADQMGLGKSLTAIEICKQVFDKYDAPALIVCPKGIRLQWQLMILDQDPDANVLIIETDFDLFRLKAVVSVDYAIIHYEALLKLCSHLAKQKFSTIVVDEAHRIKNRKAQRSVAVKTLKAARKIALTGTPYDRNPADLWSILNWLDPKAFSSYWKFMDQYIHVEMIRLGFREVPKSYRLKDPKAFVEMLRPYMLRRTKKMVMPELPSLQTTYVPIELTPKQRAAYNVIKNVKDMEVDFIELDEPLFIQNALTKLTRLLQCASDPACLELIAPSAKLEWIQEWISDHPYESVLILSRYRTAAERVFHAVGGDALVMAGKPLGSPLSASRRIVGTIASLKEGHDLGHIGTTIFIDQDYSSITMDQAFERIDRGGNTEPKQIIILEAINTADHLVTQALQSKWNTKELIDHFMQMEYVHEPA